MDIFDRAATTIERHLPAIMKRVEKARLFLFPGRAHEILPRDFDADRRVTLHETFFLPFPTIAVEDTATCTVMWDMENNQVGLDGERGFIEIQPFSTGTVGEFREGGNDEQVAMIKAQIEKFPPGSMLISEGRFGPVKLNTPAQMDFHGSVLWAALATKSDGVMAFDAVTRPRDRESLQRLQRPILSNVNTSLQEIFFFNSPDRFIVEETPMRAIERWKKRQKRIKKRNWPSRGHIRRKYERPTYTILRPNEIRTRLGLPALTVGGPRQPHERRRHYRTYRDERYKQMRGKTVIIPATWVGPSEARIGNRRYRILLDR